MTSLQYLTQIIAQVLIEDCEQFPGCLLDIQTLNINQTIRIVNRYDLHSFNHKNEETNSKIHFHNLKKNVNRSTGIHEENNNSKIKLNKIISNPSIRLDSVWYAVSVTNLRTAHDYIPNLRLGR